MQGSSRPVFRAQVEPNQPIVLGPILGAAVTPTTVAFSLRKYPERSHELADTDNRAVLELDITWEDMVVLYAEVRRYARQMDLPLPE